MFDSKQSQGQGTQTSLPPEKAVEDIFSGSDSLKRGNRPSPFVVKPQPSESIPPSPQPQPPIIQEMEDDSRPRFGGKGVLLFVLIVVVVGIAVGAAAFFLTRKSNKQSGFDVNQFVNSDPFSGNQENVNTSAPSGFLNVNSSLELPNLNSTLSLNTNTSSSSTNRNVTPEPEVPITRNVNREQVNVNIPSPVPVDRDKDGLTLEQESAFGTSDNLTDTDTDGLTDWDEVKVYRSDPLNPDTDGDGYVDGSEVKKGFSPIIAGQ